jgi:hypothetical protein
MFLEPEDNAWVEATERVKMRDREARIPPPGGRSGLLGTYARNKSMNRQMADTTDGLVLPLSWPA